VNAPHARNTDGTVAADNPCGDANIYACPGPYDDEAKTIVISHQKLILSDAWQGAIYKCGRFLGRTATISNSSATMNAYLSEWTAKRCVGVALLFTQGGARLTLSAEYALVSGANISLLASAPVTLLSRPRSRHFSVSAAVLTARNVVFSPSALPSGNTSASIGGSILVSGASTVQLVGCSFVGNMVKSSTRLVQGGALGILGGSVVAESCVFWDNTAYALGSRNTAVGGAIYRQGGTLVTSACVFLGNNASAPTAYGGAIFTSTIGSTIVTTGNFTSNFATTSGGAIYQDASTTLALNEAYFDRNQNSMTPSDDVFSKGTISPCTTTSDVVLESHGTASCPVRHTYYVRAVCGGALNDASAMVQRTTFKCGAYLNRVIPIANDSVLLNDLLSSWTLASCDGVTVSFTQSGAQLFLAREYILRWGANLTLDASNVTKPVTIFTRPSFRHFSVLGPAALTARNIIFASAPTNAPTRVSRGGSLYMNGTASVHLSGCTFRNNVIRTSALPYSHAMGGAIYLGRGSLLLEACDFVGNRVHSGFANYTAVGGAVYQAGGVLVSYDCRFLRNRVTGVARTASGGAVHSVGRTNHTRANFTGNSAVTGGAMSLGPYSLVVLTDSYMVDNYGASSGGGIYLSALSTLDLRRVAFYNNTNSRTPQDDVMNYGVIRTCVGIPGKLVLESAGKHACSVSQDRPHLAVH
jgi:predicted outer membrane repeat protein